MAAGRSSQSHSTLYSHRYHSLNLGEYLSNGWSNDEVISILRKNMKTTISLIIGLSTYEFKQQDIHKLQALFNELGNTVEFVNFDLRDRNTFTSSQTMLSNINIWARLLSDVNLAHQRISFDAITYHFAHEFFSYAPIAKRLLPAKSLRINNLPEIPEDEARLAKLVVSQIGRFTQHLNVGKLGFCTQKFIESLAHEMIYQNKKIDDDATTALVYFSPGSGESARKIFFNEYSRCKQKLLQPQEKVQKQLEKKISRETAVSVAASAASASVPMIATKHPLTTPTFISPAPAYHGGAIAMENRPSFVHGLMITVPHVNVQLQQQVDYLRQCLVVSYQELATTMTKCKQAHHIVSEKEKEINELIQALNEEQEQFQVLYQAYTEVMREISHKSGRLAATEHELSVVKEQRDTALRELANAKKQNMALPSSDCSGSYYGLFTQRSIVSPSSERDSPSSSEDELLRILASPAVLLNGNSSGI